jgi:hypothetical protein
VHSLAFHETEKPWILIRIIIIMDIIIESYAPATASMIYIDRRYGVA